MKKVTIKIKAEVTTTVMLDDIHSPSRLKNRLVDIYLHNGKEGTFADKVDLGVDTSVIEILNVEHVPTKVEILLSDDTYDQYKVFNLNENGEIFGESLKIGSLDDCVSFAKSKNYIINNYHELTNVEGTVMKDEIETQLIGKLTSLGMDIPENFEDITQFVYEDILETADVSCWNDSDVIIGLRRFMEREF